MPKTRSTKKKPQERTIPMVWNFPDDLLSRYATNILVQTGDQELYVSFFEIQHPVLLEPGDINKVESVNAECIAKIVVTPERLTLFVDVLQKQLTAFKAKKAQKANGSK
ncbi:MAG TPA: hypothetical protein VF397_17670 [Pyrinomonadaceae bacterium]